MSFSTNVKSELINKDREDGFAFLAFAYGLFLFGSSFSRGSMFIKTENPESARAYEQAAYRLAGVKATHKKSAGGTITSEIKSESDKNKIFAAFSLTGNEINLRINRANIENDEYFKDFLAGVFVSCGTVADPEKNYHLEFDVNHRQLCRDLEGIFNENEDYLAASPKTVRRKYDYILYFKGSEKIEDILTYMGAQNSALEIMNAKVKKDVRNRANRIMNCDAANVTKSVSVGIKQAKAIKKIDKIIGLSALPDELRELAIIRADNPEMSLRELAESLSVPISRSGVNHRLKRLEKIAEEL